VVVVVVVIVIYIYIYIYGYNLYVILYDDGRVGMDALSIVCRVSSYLQRIMTTRIFTVVVQLAVVMLIADCYMYLYICR